MENLAFHVGGKTFHVGGMQEVTTKCKKMKNLAFQEGGMQEASKMHEIISKMVCFLVSWVSHPNNNWYAAEHKGTVPQAYKNNIDILIKVLVYITIITH